MQSFVFLCWCQLSFHSLAAEHLTTEDKRENMQLTAKMSGMRFAVVVPVVRIDIGLLSPRYALSSVPVHSRISSSWRLSGVIRANRFARFARIR